jgi:hypothetical protein
MIMVLMRAEQKHWLFGLVFLLSVMLVSICFLFWVKFCCVRYARGGLASAPPLLLYVRAEASPLPRQC